MVDSAVLPALGMRPVRGPSQWIQHGCAGLYNESCKQLIFNRAYIHRPAEVCAQLLFFCWYAQPTLGLVSKGPRQWGAAGTVGLEMKSASTVEVSIMSALKRV